jgi:hypothetical protein
VNSREHDFETFDYMHGENITSREIWVCRRTPLLEANFLTDVGRNCRISHSLTFHAQFTEFIPGKEFTDKTPNDKRKPAKGTAHLPHPSFSTILPPLVQTSHNSNWYKHHAIIETLRTTGFTGGDEIQERLLMHLTHMSQLASPPLSSIVFLRIWCAIC